MRQLFTDEIAKEIAESIGYKYKKSEIINKRRMVNLICDNNHEFHTRWDWFKNGGRCKECQRLTYDIVKENIEKEGYILLSKEYKNYHSNLDMLCPVGHEISMQYANFIQGRRCKYCANNVRHTYEHVKNLVESEEGYKLLSDEYVNWETMLQIKCPVGHIFNMSYNSYQQGHRCPCCQRSLGEEKISKLLDLNNINYISQHKFDDCINVKSLPFDFYIPSIHTLIEYQGRQHYEPVDYFGGNVAFEEQKQRDKIKYNYCIEKNIRLIIIPYWDFKNIKEILKSEKII